MIGILPKETTLLFCLPALGANSSLQSRPIFRELPYPQKQKGSHASQYDITLFSEKMQRAFITAEGE